MDDRWGQIRQIFDSAIQRPPEERCNFVAGACRGDPSLIHEVESLLSSLDEADDFLEKPLLSIEPAFADGEGDVLEPGTLCGRYEIIEQIGEGGMGEVYLARDTDLDRKVALKLLAARILDDKDRAARFRQEAFSASALNHPNIVTIYEIGKWNQRDFIVAEYIEGLTLRSVLQQKQLSLGSALDVAAQAASALAAAHGAGVVHRDIKPENIMIRPDGLVKVLDFGIAKYLPSHEGPKALVETKVGEVIGTAAYMSPEQARGLEVDARTDVWSLGVILYEMAAGRLPFPGETRSDRIAAILEHDPPPLNKFNGKIPQQLERIVERALAKETKHRYSDIAEMAEEIHKLRGSAGDKLLSPLFLPARRSGTNRRLYLFAAALLLALAAGAAGLFYLLPGPERNTAGDRRSIAVLPLRPINESQRDELYEIGIADFLIQSLGNVDGFVVRPLGATRRYAGIDQDPIAAGREQQVDYVLASSYQIAGGRIRVISQLIHIESGKVEETYKGEKETSDLFALQDAVVGEIGELLQRHFSVAGGDRLAKRGTQSEEAYRLYLQGMYFYDRRTRADAHKAVEVLEEAVRLDPNYARAWAGLAHARRYLINLGDTERTNIHDETRRSMAAVNRALELDDNVSEAHSALCDNKMYYEYDFTGAETACRRAIELKPGSPLAHNTYGRYLMTRGRFDEAVAELRTAIELEPTSYFHQIVYLTCLALGRRYDEGLRQMDRIAELNPGNAFRLYWHNAGSLMTQEDGPQAFARWMKYLKWSNPGEETIQAYERIYQTSGWQGVMREQARRVREELTDHKFLIAAINAQAGEKDTAIDFLERSYQRREFWMTHMEHEPRLDSLRGDPRFEELVRRVEKK